MCVNQLLSNEVTYFSDCAVVWLLYRLHCLQIDNVKYKALQFSGCCSVIIILRGAPGFILCYMYIANTEALVEFVLMHIFTTLLW